MSDPTGGSDLPAGFPLISSPFVEQDSLNITRPWYQFLRQLWLRTGGALTALVSAVEAGVGIATETVNTVVTVSLAAINNGQLLANVTGAVGPPSGTDLTALLDQAVGSDPGLILTRGPLVWGPLEPGSAGFALVSQGLGNELEYAQVGTVDELTDGVNLFNDPTTLFFNGFNLTDLGGGEIEIEAPASTFDLTVTDGTNTYNDINTLFFNGANVSNPSPGEAEIIEPSGGRVGLPYGNIQGPPDSTTFSWVNQGGAAVAQVGGPATPILLTIPNAGADNWRGRFIAQPSTPYTLYAYLGFDAVSLPAGGAQIYGLYFYDGTKLMGIEFISVNAGGIACQLRVQKITNVTTGGSTAAARPSSFSVGEVPYIGFADYLPLKLTNDGVNLKFSYSLDGWNWIDLFSEAIGTFITPTEIGFAGLNTNAVDSADLHVSLLSWKTGP